MTKNTTTNSQIKTSIKVSGTDAHSTTHYDINHSSGAAITSNYAAFGTGMTPHLKSWLNALQHANDLLPNHLRFDDVNLDISTQTNGKISLDLIEQLETLPVFALSVVVHQQALVYGDNTDKKLAFESHIDEWVSKNPSWQIIRVQHTSHSLYDTKDNDSLTPVFTYRYILLPTEASSMHPSKKAAAAHLLDDTITSHLRQFIEKLPITANMGGDSAIDCHIVPLAKILRPHRVICFDMDSTLIEQEVIVEIAKHAGIGAEVSRITESAMRGEIDFDTSFSKRLSLLSGLSTQALDEIQSQLTITSGAHTLMPTLKSLGYHIVLISGGFSYFADKIAQILGIDEVYSNELDIEDGVITGDVRLPIVNGEYKASLVNKIAKRKGITPAQVVCVGDGANDLPMMAIADLGIAYHAKPIVRARADAAINATGLEGVLYVLGYSAKDLT